MKRTHYTVLTIFVLAFLSCLYIYKYLKVKAENQELKTLLTKASYSIDRDNSHTYYDLEDIFNYKHTPEIEKKKTYFERLISNQKRLDSNELSKNLVTIIKERTKLNDSLVDFARNWCSIPILWDKTFIENLAHEPLYKFGDTVNLITNFVDVAGFKKDNSSIVSFSPKEFGTQYGNCIQFLIPTKRLFTSIKQPRHYTFTYNLVTKNIYINKYDTSRFSKAFTILP